MYPQSKLLASVFYHRIASLAVELECSRGVILGYALAHEVGHLLLGVNSHSPTGIMRVNWAEKELRLASTGWFGFFPQQAAKMHADVERRMRVQVAVARLEPVPAK